MVSCVESEIQLWTALACDSSGGRIPNSMTEFLEPAPISTFPWTDPGSDHFFGPAPTRVSSAFLGISGDGQFLHSIILRLSC